jgi:hypothetical protein
MGRSREKEEANEFLYLLFTVLQQHPEKKRNIYIKLGSAAAGQRW